MARLTWMNALVAFASLAHGQSSLTNAADGLTTDAGSATATVGTATINGSPTTYSVAFTVPAEADVGPSLLPNVLDPQAVQAQTVCPGYTASDVQKTENGMTARLTLAGDAVRDQPTPARSKTSEELTRASATSTAQTSTN